MFEPPRVLAVDDEQAHLDGLANGLQRNGVACLPIHFTGDPSALKPCPDVRIIFTDLNLTGPASDHTGQFSTLGGLLEKTIAPRGPYFIILWTQYPDQATALEEFLNKRIVGVTKPFAVRSLAKADHLDHAGNLRDEGRLMKAIRDLIAELPQVAALFNWESRVLRAAGNTVSSLLAPASSDASADRAAEAGRILRWLGIAAVGENHVDDDRFRAVNEALLPILADVIAKLRADDDAAVWQAALPAGRPNSLSQEEAARLNGMVHVDTKPTSGVGRGNVILLPPCVQQSFEERFGIDELAAARKQFHCTDFATGDDRYRWVLVQSQAACDYAQSRPGPVPCSLGLEMPYPTGRSGSPPAALWTSPALQLPSRTLQLQLRVSAAFPVSFGPTKFDQRKPIYRLREQILNDLIYHVHSHSGRPGFLSFRG